MPVAQLDRASASEAEGLEFESQRARILIEVEDREFALGFFLFLQIISTHLKTDAIGKKRFASDILWRPDLIVAYILLVPPPMVLISLLLFKTSFLIF